VDQHRRPRLSADRETSVDINAAAARKVVSLHRGRGLSKTLAIEEGAPLKKQP